MKKKNLKLFCFFLFLPLIILSSCDINYNNNPASNDLIDEKEEQDEMKDLKLLINDNMLDVTWEESSSIEDLKKLANNTLTINMHPYGGFEQVGSIGQSIKSNDKKITTSPGDICLYSSNQIAIFYGNNTWSYTYLGHINLPKNELETLLSGDNVIIKFILV